MSIKGRSETVWVHPVEIVVFAVDEDDRDLLAIFRFQDRVTLNKALFDLEM